MLTWQEIVRNYIIKYSNQITAATKPLRDCFGIDYFTYHKIDREGRYTVLVDRPDWAERYVGEKIYLQDPYLRNFEAYRTGVALIESHGTEEYQELVLKNGKEVLQVDAGVIAIEKSESFVEFFGFAAKKNILEEIALNEPQLLKSFGAHFKRELAPVLRKMEREAPLLSHLKGEDFFAKEVVGSSIEPAEKARYYKALGMESGLERLSPREIDCLKGLLKGETAKETACQLNLSPRTVEFYFENIKDKLGCFSKGDVLKAAKRFDELKLLP